MVKRMFDLLASTFGLLLLAPLLLLLAILIRLNSPGAIFFRQERVGRSGRIFRIIKFRTMLAGAEYSGLQITVGNDVRITPIGKWLRKYKLDELPQLLNVLQGHMSLVGPRPEVARYVEFYPKKIRDVVLSVRPGITDPASIVFKNESDLLGLVTDPHLTYVNEVLPIKLNYYVEYVNSRTFLGDIKLIFKTFTSLIR